MRWMARLAAVGLMVGMVTGASALSESEIATWRARGPEGLAAFREAHGPIAAPDKGPSEEAAARRTAYDQIAGQRDAWAANLYWHTTAEDAIAEARRTGRPILMLAMLGKLTDDLSCANSRFFRTVLYADERVADYLRENFVLHWHTMRPVPVVEIDFGDGRKLKRTITGNSAHLVLDSEGQPVDAMPGLYGAEAFLAALAESHELATRCAAATDPAARAAILAEWHNQQAERKEARLAAARQSVKAEATADAGSAALVAEWEAIARELGIGAALSAGSRRVMAAKRAGDPDAAMRLALSKSIVEDPLARMVKGMERSLAADTARNEFELRPAIHRMLAAEPGISRQAFSARIYEEVFLMPTRDRWLGLAPEDVYTGIDRGGVEWPSGQHAFIEAGPILLQSLPRAH